MQLSDKELYADSIEFSYNGSHQLLTGGYLNCLIGDCVALLGRNGCGKSTLLKIVFGALHAKFAFIRLNGKRVKRAFLTKDVCYLPQESFLPTSIRVVDAAKLMIDDKVKMEHILSDELLNPLRQQKIADLSGGERRYLEILLLINQPASFILLDEPFSGVSPIVKDKISQLIISHREQKGFIISDHDYRYVLDICNNIVLLANGSCRVLKDRRELELFYVPEGTFDQD